MGEWKTIDSAPKDTAVLVYGFGYTVAHFNRAYGKWIAFGSDTADTRALVSSPPTHWTELPPPPKD